MNTEQSSDTADKSHHLTCNKSARHIEQINNIWSKKKKKKRKKICEKESGKKRHRYRLIDRQIDG